MNLNKLFLSTALMCLLTVSISPALCPAQEKNSSSDRSVELNEQGISAIQSKNFKGAEEYFRKAVAADSGNLTAIFNLAGALMNNGKSAEAVTLLNNTVAEVKNDSGLYTRLGDAYLATKNVENALKAYESAYKLDPTYPALAAKLATAYGLSNRTADAEKMTEKAVEATPNDGKLMANLASLYLANGKKDMAIGAAKRAIQIKPGPEVYVTLGTAYELSNDYKNALIAFERARDLGDKRPEIEKKIAGLSEAANR